MKRLLLIPTLALLAGCTGALSAGVTTAGGATGPNGGLLPNTSTQVGSSKTVKDIRVSPDNFVVTVGDAKDLIANVSYTDGTFDGNVTWSASDSRIVDVNPTTGKLQAKAEGVASIVVASLTDPTRKANVTVTVRKGTVQEALAKVDPKEATVKVGETVQLSAQIQLSDGSNSPNVVWSTSSQSVAIVSGAGLVTGVGKGTVTITATASGDATKKATCKVTVEE